MHWWPQDAVRPVRPQVGGATPVKSPRVTPGALGNVATGDVAPAPDDVMRMPHPLVKTLQFLLIL